MGFGLEIERAEHLEGGRGTQFVHGRCRMTIDPSIPTMPGRSTSGFSPTRQTLHAPSAKRREVFGESHEGWNYILPRSARKTDFGISCPLSYLWRIATNGLYFVFWCVGEGGEDRAWEAGRLVWGFGVEQVKAILRYYSRVHHNFSWAPGVRGSNIIDPKHDFEERRSFGFAQYTPTISFCALLMVVLNSPETKALVTFSHTLGSTYDTNR